MNSFISSIQHSPVKSLSFSSIEKCEIQKNLGIIYDRIFAFTRNIDFKKAKLIENPRASKSDVPRIENLKALII